MILSLAVNVSCYVLHRTPIQVDVVVYDTNKLPIDSDKSKLPR